MESDIAVLGCCRTGEEALQTLREHQAILRREAGVRGHGGLLADREAEVACAVANGLRTP